MAKAGDDSSLIVLEQFIQATRDSGYKDTNSAIAELVDNSLQAGAKHVSVTIASSDDEEHPNIVYVLDDGCGMDRKTLRQALRFGGSSRFNDRAGLGRFGMGLPNSSLSQARRVEVFSWIKSGPVLFCYLDVDEIARGEMSEVPNPISKSLPKSLELSPRRSGTLVLWSRCDRLSHSRVSTIARKLSRSLGQIFRHFIWSGASIMVNGENVEAIDPLFLKGPYRAEGTVIFGEPHRYEVAAPISKGAKRITSWVTVTFTELPVHALHDLSNEEKRERGIANGAGVSIVRGNREVDFGWFFLNGKRRENYDDWWRCEVAFEPVLDEAFGITHTKQGIRPQEYLSELLSTDMESFAKSLNARVRQAHLRRKAGEATKAAETTAVSHERLLPPLPTNSLDTAESAIVKSLLKQVPALKEPPAHDGLDYRIVEADIKENSFFSFAITNGRLILIINPEHPFHRRIYKPLSELDTAEAKQARTHLDLLLLAAVRAEAAATRTGDSRAIEENRQRWSDVLATFLNR